MLDPLPPNPPNFPKPQTPVPAAPGGLTFDEALTRHVGELGRGTRRIVGCASLFGVATALSYLSYVFLTIDPVSSGQWQCTDPHDAACAAVLSGAPSRSISKQAFCSLSPEQWRFTSMDSLAAQFSLVCGSAWKVQIANSIMFVGCFIGSGLFGALADRIGRRLPLFIATAIVVAATFTSLAAHSYWGYAATRAVIGFGAAGQSQAIFLLCTESTGPGYRAVANMGVMIAFTVGEFLLAGLAAALPNWRHLTLAVGAINAAALLLFPLIPESARWLLSQGRTQEATALLAKLAAANGTHMPREPLVRSCSSKWHAENSPVTLLQLLGSASLMGRLLVLALGFFSQALAYFAVSLGSGGLPGSIYITFVAQAAAEVLAVLAAGLLADRAGRHGSAALGLLLAGGGSLGSALLAHNASSTGRALAAVLAAVGKFGATVAMAVLAVFAAELFPTSVRSTMLGLLSQAARLGALTAPFLLAAGAHAASGTSVICAAFIAAAVASLLAGLLLLTQPETAGRPLPESLEDMAALQSLFAAKPWRQGCGATLAFVLRRSGQASSSSALQSQDGRGLDRDDVEASPADAITIDCLGMDDAEDSCKTLTTAITLPDGPGSDQGPAVAHPITPLPVTAPAVAATG